MTQVWLKIRDQSVHAMREVFIPLPFQIQSALVALLWDTSSSVLLHPQAHQMNEAMSCNAACDEILAI